MKENATTPKKSFVSPKSTPAKSTHNPQTTPIPLPIPFPRLDFEPDPPSIQNSGYDIKDPSCIPSTSSGSRKEFVDVMMQNASPTRRQMLAASTIKEAQNNQKTKGAVLLPQASGGPSMPCIMGKNKIEQVVKDSQAQIPLKMFHDWQSDRGSSNKTVLDLAKRIRAATHGKKSIEKGLKQSLVDRTKAVAPFFAPKTLDMEVRPAKGKV